MGCGWWNPPTPYKEDCYWYREEQDMNAHIPYCLCNNKFPLDSCENCENYHSRSKRTQGDRIRAMTDEQLAEWLCDIAGWLPEYEGRMHPILEWLKEETTE
jgi:hypothetical protein